MKLFVTLVNGFQSLTDVTKGSIIDVVVKQHQWHELGPRTNTDKHVSRKRLLRLKDSASLFCKLMHWFRKIGLSYTFSLYEH